MFASEFEYPDEDYNIIMDPTFGEIIAGKIHLFCAQQIVKKNKFPK
jgi:hypothetical protein